MSTKSYDLSTYWKFKWVIFCIMSNVYFINGCKTLRKNNHLGHWDILLLDVLLFRVLAGGWRGLGAATLMAAAVSPRDGSYSSPELSLATGDAARFFLDFLWPMSAIEVGVGVTYNRNKHYEIHIMLYEINVTNHNFMLINKQVIYQQFSTLILISS